MLDSVSLYVLKDLLSYFRQLFELRVYGFDVNIFRIILIGAIADLAFRGRIYIRYILIVVLHILSFLFLTYYTIDESEIEGIMLQVYWTPVELCFLAIGLFGMRALILAWRKSFNIRGGKKTG